jgi:hypothetical protein
MFVFELHHYAKMDLRLRHHRAALFRSEATVLPPQSRPGASDDEVYQQ